MHLFLFCMTCATHLNKSLRWNCKLWALRKKIIQSNKGKRCQFKYILNANFKRYANKNKNVKKKKKTALIFWIWRYFTFHLRSFFKNFLSYEHRLSQKKRKKNKNIRKTLRTCGYTKRAFVKSTRKAKITRTQTGRCVDLHLKGKEHSSENQKGSSFEQRQKVWDGGEESHLNKMRKTTTDSGLSLKNEGLFVKQDKCMCFGCSCTNNHFSDT